MRKLTDKDIANILGKNNGGYTVVKAKIKENKEFCDSDNYGIVFGENEKGLFVIWQFHLDENEEPSYYWGYYTECENSAHENYDSRN
jgi:hypothetical protein